MKCAAAALALVGAASAAAVKRGDATGTWNDWASATTITVYSTVTSVVPTTIVSTVPTTVTVPTTIYSTVTSEWVDWKYSTITVPTTIVSTVTGKLLPLPQGYFALYIRYKLTATFSSYHHHRSNHNLRDYHI